MGLIGKIVSWHRQKVEERNRRCDDLIVRIDRASAELEQMFSDPRAFVDPAQEQRWKTRHASLLLPMDAAESERLKKAARYRDLLLKQTGLSDRAGRLKARIVLHNKKAADIRIQDAYALIGNVEGRRLDRQQMSCIVKEAHNHLVIAGAGTGKTTTIVGKIKFLLRSGKCAPEDILVLSFTNASAAEMKARIEKETGHAIAASTFHKLGLDILTKVNGIVPKITQIDLRKFIREQIERNMQSRQYLQLLCSYLLFGRVIYRSEFSFTSQAEYDEYLKLDPPTTIKNEKVKSYGEMDIANFLLQNGVRYIYEEPYKIDTRTSEYGQYKPDFYLPDYGIYIEYFGIDKNGEVPLYFQGTDGMTATQTYQRSMEWKRALHRENGTVMIECYAYEKFDGELLDRLKEKLAASGVELAPQDPEQLWQQLSAGERSVLDGIVELFETAVNLIKSNGYTIETVRRLNEGTAEAQNNGVILSLLEPIYHAYLTHLAQHEEIDFHDMINTAAAYVAQGKFMHAYRYVIVDEYQDISKARFSLLNTMRRSHDFDLFCVGDDWQSIYRFAGSDIGYILNFERYWGPTEISRIETTYRFPQKLVDISSGFIMKDPAQIRKDIKGTGDPAGSVLGEIDGYTEKYAVKFTVDKLDDLPKGSSVFFIGRYSFDVKLLSDNEQLACRYERRVGTVEVNYAKRPDLQMRFLTAHRAKGLQADYVFIINNKDARMGFPSKIQNAPLLDLLLDGCDRYPYAEERRLFYVALTRAKKKVFLVTVKDRLSDFILELHGCYEDELKRERWECPVCGGRLLKKAGPFGEFYGCSNYKTTGCRYKRPIRPKAKD